MNQPTESRKWRKHLWLALRVALPVVVFAYLLAIVPLEDLALSLRRVSPWSFLVALVSIVSALVVGALRWRLLFIACGVEAGVRVRDLLRLHWVGHFYNCYLPGGVGGDLVRAMGTRGLTGERGLPGALAIVFLERTLGLSGLLTLVAVSLAFFPLEGVKGAVHWTIIGLLATACVVAGIALGARLAPYLPRQLARQVARLPTIESFPHFIAAMLLSVVTQVTGVVIAGHVLMASIAGDVRFSASAGVLPLIGAAQYFPLTVGGAGVREAGFIFFYGLVGVEKASALAASFAYAGAQYCVAAVGGLIHALVPLSVANANESSGAVRPAAAGGEIGPER